MHTVRNQYVLGPLGLQMDVSLRREQAHCSNAQHTHRLQRKYRTVFMEVCVHSSQRENREKQRDIWAVKSLWMCSPKKSWWATMRQSPRLGLSRELRWEVQSNEKCHEIQQGDIHWITNISSKKERDCEKVEWLMRLYQFCCRGQE